MAKFPITLIVLLFSIFAIGIHGYSVSGNKILDPNGKAVLLKGMCRPSFEWNPNGEYASLEDYQLMKDWGSNVVRLALNQNFWLPGAATYNANYQSTIHQQVQWIKSLGMGVILELHWSDQGNLAWGGSQQCMADRNSITFWIQVATKYKNDPWIIFELYNEPHDVSWSTWRNGGNECGFAVAGMQQLYNAIRATGANNVVVIGGLNWAFDLSGVSSHGVTGTNIAYATHPYDYPGKQPGDWDAAFGNLAATYPILATEFGQYCNNNNYVETLLDYFQRKGIHWTGWAWYVNGCSFPSLIADWSGTPTETGVLVKAALASGRNGTSTTGSSTTGTTTGSSVPPATSNMVVYDNALRNGWQDWSWGTRNFANTFPTHSGTKSISFVANEWAGLYFHSSTNFNPYKYQNIRFWVHGGSNSNQALRVLLYGTNVSPVGKQVALPTAIQANTWVRQVIPISAFGLASTTLISGFAIQANTGGVQGTIYVDNVIFSPYKI
jgi:endoglucanase